MLKALQRNPFSNIQGTKIMSLIKQFLKASGIGDKAKWWAGQVCDEYIPVCQVGASAAAIRAWW